MKFIVMTHLHNFMATLYSENMDVKIRLGTVTVSNALLKTASTKDKRQYVSPGDVITTDVGFMRGHGTYIENDELKASVAGVVERVNKLISVRPLKTRYNGEIGDVVVGRVVEVQQRRWIVDTNSRLNSILLLSSANLPGGELRRRSATDELLMRQYLSEGDLISAEVQSVYSDGSLSLHTRSLKYGKLSQGSLVKVSPTLIKRRKTHFHYLPCGVSVILGNNGYIWVSPKFSEIEEDDGGFVETNERISKTVREMVARVRNCVLCLARFKLLLYDTSIIYAYDVSSKFSVKEINTPENMNEIISMVRQRHEIEG